MATGAFLLYGDDESLVQRRAEDLIGAALRREPDCQLEIISGRIATVQDFRDFQKTLAETLNTLPLFSSQRCIWVKSITFLGGPVAEESMELLAQIGEELKRAKGFAVTVILSACPVDRRLRAFKLLKSCGESIEVEGDGPAAAEDAFARGADALALSFDLPSRRLFLAKMGPSARYVAAELEKLAIYLGERKKVTVEDVREVVCEAPQENFFEPVEAFYRRDMAIFTASVRRFLAAGGEPRALLAAFQSRNRMLLQLRAIRQLSLWRTGGMGIPTKEILQRARSLRRVSVSAEGDSADVFSQNPWYLGRLAESIEFFQLEELLSIQGKLLEIFEALLLEWQDVSPIWFLDRFLSLCGCLGDGSGCSAAARIGHG